MTHRFDSSIIARKSLQPQQGQPPVVCMHNANRAVKRKVRSGLWRERGTPVRTVLHPFAVGFAPRHHSSRCTTPNIPLVFLKQHPKENPQDRATATCEESRDKIVTAHDSTMTKKKKNTQLVDHPTLASSHISAFFLPSYTASKIPEKETTTLKTDPESSLTPPLPTTAHAPCLLGFCSSSGLARAAQKFKKLPKLPSPKHTQTRRRGGGGSCPVLRIAPETLLLQARAVPNHRTPKQSR